MRYSGLGHSGSPPVTAFFFRVLAFAAILPHVSGFYMLVLGPGREDWWDNHRGVEGPLPQYENIGRCYQIPQSSGVGDGDIEEVVIYNPPSEQPVRIVGFWASDDCDDGGRREPDFAIQLDSEELFGISVVLSSKLPERLRGRSFRALTAPDEISQPGGYLTGAEQSVENGAVYIWSPVSPGSNRENREVTSLPGVVGSIKTFWWLPEASRTRAHLLLRDLAERLLNVRRSQRHSPTIASGLENAVSAERKAELSAIARLEGIGRVEDIYQNPIPVNIRRGALNRRYPGILRSPSVLGATRGTARDTDGALLLADFDGGVSQASDEQIGPLEVPEALDGMETSLDTPEEILSLNGVRAFSEEPVPGAFLTSAALPEENGNLDILQSIGNEADITGSFVDYAAPDIPRSDSVGGWAQTGPRMVPESTIQRGDPLSAILARLDSRIRDPSAGPAQDKAMQILSHLDSLLLDFYQISPDMRPPSLQPVRGTFDPMSMQQSRVFLSDNNNPTAGLVENQELLDSFRNGPPGSFDFDAEDSGFRYLSRGGSADPPRQEDRAQNNLHQPDNSMGISAAVPGRVLSEGGGTSSGEVVRQIVVGGDRNTAAELERLEEEVRFGSALDDEEEAVLLQQRLSFISNRMKRLKGESSGT
ncbi:hypothetical protein DRE_02938 [Drechslerella stenobrocha 248]|uniref:Uncharacterized protein n=1 Tax=Drechslerella stenobrocha 248 TaxID=1043628 RepID=W7I6D5_9PEZI|nr:hypothetical protein DRE_02938 [Drechslerella stenobrocha 248]